MVRVFFLILAMLCLSSFNHPSHDDVMISVEVHDELASENQPFFAKLIVSRPDHLQVDESSFKLEGKPLDIHFKTHSRQSSIMDLNGKRYEEHRIISYYVFEMGSQNKGMHTLPVISLSVGGKVYESEPVSYFINSPETSQNFNLTAFIDAPKPLYPGQNFTVTYRLTMAEPVELFYENLPMLDLKNFVKKGKRHSRSFYQGNKRVQEYIQAYEAKEAGDFPIEASFVEGRVFTEDLFGKRHYRKEMKRAEASAVHLVVEEFPLAGKPASFNGAVGQFNMKVSLESPTQVSVGDKVKLKLAFNGDDGISTVHLPNISNQKGFKDHFRLNDLPLSAQSTQGAKEFVCELRPMKENITEIPPIEFSYFNPKTQTYHTMTSQSIPITLIPLRSQTELDKTPVALTEKKEELKELKAAPVQEGYEQKSSQLIDIKGVYPITDAELKLHKLRPSEIAIFTVLLVIGLAQLFVKYFSPMKSKKKDSSFYLEQALKNKEHLQNYQLLLEKALLLRLKEKQLIHEATSIDHLEHHGILGEVKEFIQDLQMQLFSGQKSFDLDSSYQLAKTLYKKIGDHS